jgi:predicted small secreted protein
VTSPRQEPTFIDHPEMVATSKSGTAPPLQPTETSKRSATTQSTLPAVNEELWRGGAVVIEWPPLKEREMFKKFVTRALLASGLALAAFNTVEGAGKDVESVGEAAEDAVK